MNANRLSRRHLLRRAVGYGAAGALAATAPWLADGTGRAQADNNNFTSRPIEDWVDAQGTYCSPDVINGRCLEFLPGIKRNVVAWANLDGSLCAIVDLYGIIADYLFQTSGGMVSTPIKLTGTIQEEALGDGSAYVTVKVETKNAVTWVVRDCGWLDSPLYGARYDEILGGATPTLSDTKLNFEFINVRPGAPLPDLIDIVYNSWSKFQPASLKCYGEGDGLLRAAFGVPEGTPGHFFADIVSWKMAMDTQIYRDRGRIVLKANKS
jgi:hypothetical protein